METGPHRDPARHLGWRQPRLTGTKICCPSRAISSATCLGCWRITSRIWSTLHGLAVERRAARRRPARRPRAPGRWPARSAGRGRRPPRASRRVAAAARPGPASRDRRWRRRRRSRHVRLPSATAQRVRGLVAPHRAAPFVARLRQADAAGHVTGGVHRLPSNAVITSPASGRPRRRRCRWSRWRPTAPSGDFMPNDSASGADRSCNVTPRRACSTVPCATISSFTCSATSIGMANASPWKPPLLRVDLRVDADHAAVRRRTADRPSCPG